MVMLVMSVESNPGRVKEGIELQKRIIAHEKKTFGVEFQLARRYTPALGQAFRLILMATFDSLTALAEYQEKAQNDAGRQALIEEGFYAKDAIYAHNSFSRTILTLL